MSFCVHCDHMQYLDEHYWCTRLSAHECDPVTGGESRKGWLDCASERAGAVPFNRPNHTPCYPQGVYFKSKEV